MIWKNRLRTFSWSWTLATPGARSNWLVTTAYFVGSPSWTRKLCGMSPSWTLPVIGLLRNCSLKRSKASASDSWKTSLTSGIASSWFSMLCCCASVAAWPWQLGWSELSVHR